MEHLSLIPVVCVSYNSVDLVSDLLHSFRKFYTNPIHIIDGSNEDIALQISKLTSQFDDVNFVHFDYNIHHGPGMAWAINNLDLEGRVLFLDSDVFILKKGFLESLNENLKENMYGVGSVNFVNEDGFNVDFFEGAIPYLHPACMLCNINEMRKWPLPIKHGAPMTAAMLALHKTGKSDLLGHVEWVKNDFKNEATKEFIRHDWQGTVKRTGGYHLEEWQELANVKALFRANFLTLIPPETKNLIHVNCESGALAREYRLVNPACQIRGVESDEDNAKIAGIFFDQIVNKDFRELTRSDFIGFSKVDCWILPNVLESVPDPSEFLMQIRETLSPGGCVLISIKNPQHWSLLGKFVLGDSIFNYSEIFCN